LKFNFALLSRTKAILKDSTEKVSDSGMPAVISAVNIVVGGGQLR